MTRVVQHVEGIHSGFNVPLDLPAPATAGNTLVIWGVARSSGNTVNTPPGFTQVPGSPNATVLTSNTGNNGLQGLFTKVAVGGEQHYDLNCATGTGDMAAGIFELSKGSVIIGSTVLDDQPASSHPIMALAGPGSSVVVIAVFSEGDSNNPTSSDAPWIQVFSGTVIVGGFGQFSHPGPAATVMYLDDSLLTSFSPGFTKAGADKWAGFGLVLQGSGGLAPFAGEPGGGVW